MHVQTYLTFDGNCREAFEFYREVFGGEFGMLLTFADGPPELNIPENEQGRVMHMSLPIGSSVLMGSDSSNAFGPPPQMGDNFSLSVAADSREHCDELFAKLSPGASGVIPMQDQFWGSYFGRLTDKFGIGWQISFENRASQ